MPANALENLQSKVTGGRKFDSCDLEKGLNGIRAIFEVKKCDNPEIRSTFDLENKSMPTI